MQQTRDYKQPYDVSRPDRGKFPRPRRQGLPGAVRRPHAVYECGTARQTFSRRGGNSVHERARAGTATARRCAPKFLKKPETVWRSRDTKAMGGSDLREGALP